MKLIASIRRYFDARAEAKTLALLEAEDAILTELIKQHRLLNRQRMARIRMGAKHIGHPDYRFNGRHSKKKLEGEAYATPRSWRMAANLVEAKLPFDVMMDMLNGTVGKGPAAEFVGFMQVWHKMPSIDGILIDPHGARVPDDAATMFAVSAALASRAVPDNMDAITAYINRVPPEFSVLTIKDTQRRNPSCMMTKAFVQWANKNASLLG